MPCARRSFIARLLRCLDRHVRATAGDVCIHWWCLMCHRVWSRCVSLCEPPFWAISVWASQGWPVFGHADEVFFRCARYVPHTQLQSPRPSTHTRWASHPSGCRTRGRGASSIYDYMSVSHPWRQAARTAVPHRSGETPHTVMRNKVAEGVPEADGAAESDKTTVSVAAGQVEFATLCACPAGSCTTPSDEVTVVRRH